MLSSYETTPHLYTSFHLHLIASIRQKVIISVKQQQGNKLLSTWGDTWLRCSHLSERRFELSRRLLSRACRDRPGWREGEGVPAQCLHTLHRAGTRQPPPQPLCPHCTHTCRHTQNHSPWGSGLPYDPHLITLQCSLYLNMTNTF